MIHIIGHVESKCRWWCQKTIFTMSFSPYPDIKKNKFPDQNGGWKSKKYKNELF